MSIHTLHVDNDAGDVDNIFNLAPAQLRARQVVRVDAGSEGEAIRKTHGYVPRLYMCLHDHATHSSLTH